MIAQPAKPDFPAAERVELIPLELCRPSDYNPRTFSPKPSPQLVELGMSIRRTGQVQPATVRPLDSRFAPIAFEIVAGERRWRACRLRAKGETELVPADAWVGDAKLGAELVAAGQPVEFLRAVVRDLTDEQAQEICCVENLDREDLQPLEEAKGVQTLLALYKGDVEAVAARVSRPVSWVAARARLSTLTPSCREALANEKRGFHTWTAAHLVEIAKLAPVAQDALLKGLHHPADRCRKRMSKMRRAG
jgi:ParB family chromosome partitioning protein